MEALNVLCLCIGVNTWQPDSSSGSEREDAQTVWDMPTHESPG